MMNNAFDKDNLGPVILNAIPPDWIPFLGASLAFFIAWSIFWKGLALWHSGRRNLPVWFIVFLLVNTVGILEIIFLFFVLKLKFSQLFSLREEK